MFKIKSKMWLKSLIVGLVCVFTLNGIPCIDGAFALAPWAGIERVSVRRNVLQALLEKTRIIYADDDEKKGLLSLNNAEALLLSHGKLLVSENLKDDDLRLLRAVIHEEIEAVMQIMAGEDETNFNAIKDLILTQTIVLETYYRLFPEDKKPDLPTNLLLNDIIANAFELLTLMKSGLMNEGELGSDEKAFLEVMRPIILTNKHNYFTSAFWNWRIRETKIRVALANGQRFYQVVSGQKELDQDPASITPEKSKKSRRFLFEFARAYYMRYKSFADVVGLDQEITLLAKEAIISSEMAKKFSRDTKKPVLVVGITKTGTPYTWAMEDPLTQLSVEKRTLFQAEVQNEKKYLKRFPGPERNRIALFTVARRWMKRGELAWFTHCINYRISSIYGFSHVKTFLNKRKRFFELIKPGLIFLDSSRTRVFPRSFGHIIDEMEARKGESSGYNYDYIKIAHPIAYQLDDWDGWHDTRPDNYDVVSVGEPFIITEDFMRNYNKTAREKDIICLLLNPARQAWNGAIRPFKENAWHDDEAFGPLLEEVGENLLEKDFFEQVVRERIKELKVKKWDPQVSEPVNKKPHAPGHPATFFELIYSSEFKGKAVPFEELRKKVKNKRTGEPISIAVVKMDLSLLVRSGLARKEGEGKSAIYTSTINDEVLIWSIHKNLSALKTRANIKEVQAAVAKYIFEHEFGGETKQVMKFFGIREHKEITRYEKKQIRKRIYRHELTFADNGKIAFYTKDYKGYVVTLKMKEEMFEKEIRLMEIAGNHGLAPKPELMKIKGEPVLFHLEPGGKSLTGLESHEIDLNVVKAIGFALGKLHELGICHHQLYENPSFPNMRKPYFLIKEHFFIERNVHGDINANFINFTYSDYDPSLGHLRDHCIEERYETQEALVRFARHLDPREIKVYFEEGYREGVESLDKPPFRKINETPDLQGITEESAEYEIAKDYVFSIFKDVNRNETEEANLLFSAGDAGESGGVDYSDNGDKADISYERRIESIIDEEKLSVREFSSSLLPSAICYEDGQIEINSNFIKLIAYLRRMRLDTVRVKDPVTRKESYLLRSIVYSMALHEIRGHYVPRRDGTIEFRDDESIAQSERGYYYQRLNVNAILFYWLSLCENRVGKDLHKRVIEFLNEADEGTGDTYGEMLGVEIRVYESIAGLIEFWSKLTAKYRPKYVPARESPGEAFARAVPWWEERRHSMNEGKNLPRGSPAKFIKIMYTRFRHRKIGIKEYARELGLALSTVVRDASGFIEAGLIKRVGKNEDAIIEVALKDLEDNIIDELKNRLKVLGRRARVGRVKEIVEEVLEPHKIKPKVKRTIGDGTFEPMEDIPVARKKRIRFLPAKDRIYIETLKQQILREFGRIAESPAKRAFTGEEMNEFSAIAAGALVRYGPESLESLVKRDILSDSETASILKREPLPIDGSTKNITAVKNIIAILANYDILEFTEKTQKTLLSNFFTVQELELYKKLYPDTWTSDVFSLCRRRPSDVRELLAAIDRTSRGMRGEPEFKRVPPWIILKSCYQDLEDPRELLMRAMKMADEAIEEAPDRVLPYVRLLSVCLRTPKKLDEFLRPYLEEKPQRKRGNCVPLQGEIPIVYRKKMKRELTSREKEYRDALKRQIYESLQNIEPGLPEKEKQEYSSTVAQALVKYDERSIYGLVYRNLLNLNEAKSIIGRKKFKTDELAHTILSIVDGYKDSSLNGGIRMGTGTRLRFLGHFYTASELTAIKQTFPDMPDYLIIRACLNCPGRTIEFLRGVERDKNSIRKEERFAGIPDWLVYNACGHHHSRSKAYLIDFMEGRIAYKVFGIEYVYRDGAVIELKPSPKPLFGPNTLGAAGQPDGWECDPETLDFNSSLMLLKETAQHEEFGYDAQAARLKEQAANYNKKGQSLILYADDLLQNAAVMDMESTLKNISTKHNILKGGKIVIFARNPANATILERMIKRADSDLITITITEEELKETKNLNGSEIKEIECVVEIAKARGTKNILTLIKGPTRDLEGLAAPLKDFKFPIVIVGAMGKGVYSFAEAMTRSIEKADNGWLIVLSPVRPYSEEIQRQYEEYLRSLKLLQAA